MSFFCAFIESIETKEITLNILNDLTIPLPLNNKNEIDIKQVDKFINNLKSNIKFKSLNNNVNAKPLDLNMEEWREYKLWTIVNKVDIKILKKRQKSLPY